MNSDKGVMTGSILKHPKVAIEGFAVEADFPPSFLIAWVASIQLSESPPAFLTPSYLACSSQPLTLGFHRAPCYLFWVFGGGGGGLVAY